MCRRCWQRAGRPEAIIPLTPQVLAGIGRGIGAASDGGGATVVNFYNYGTLTENDATAWVANAIAEGKARGCVIWDDDFPVGTPCQGRLGWRRKLCPPPGRYRHDLIRPLSALRGRDYGSQIYSESIAGKLVAHLRNADGKYNNLARQSVLQGLVLPRRKVAFGTPVAESFSRVVIRASITSLTGTDYLSWDSAAGSIPGNDLEIQTGLTAALGSWQSSVFEIQRGSTELVSMATAFAAVELSGKSLYVVVGERTAEMPSGLRYATGSDDERQQWMVPNSAPWAIVRDVLDSVGEGDEFEVLIADPGGFTAHLSPLWTGYVSTVVPIEYPGGNDEVALTAQGIMSELTAAASQPNWKKISAATLRPGSSCKLQGSRCCHREVGCAQEDCPLVVGPPSGPSDTA